MPFTEPFRSYLRVRARILGVGCGWVKSRDFRVDGFLRVVFYCFFCRAIFLNLGGE